MHCTCYPGARVCRAGLTILEQLIVISIISVMVSLLSVAIASSRESARKLHCASRLSEISKANANYESQSGRFPRPALMFSQSGNGQQFPSGVSIQATLLPFLGRDDLYNSINLNDSMPESQLEPPGSVLNATLMQTRVDLFECPSDSVPAGGCSYRACAGTGPAPYQAMAGTPFESTLPGFVRGGGLVSRNVADGLSNTVFFSEKIVGDRDQTRISGWSDVFHEPAASGVIHPEVLRMACRNVTGTGGHYSYGGAWWLPQGFHATWYNHVLGPNSEIPDCSGSSGTTGGGEGAYAARSCHSAGVNAAFGDGSVRFISETIDLAVWRAMASVAGGD